MQDPLSIPSAIRLQLDACQAAELLRHGECFAIVGRSSYPEAAGGMAIYLQSIPMEAAAAACGVAMGTHSAKRIKPEKS